MQTIQSSLLYYKSIFDTEPLSIMSGCAFTILLRNLFYGLSLAVMLVKSTTWGLSCLRTRLEQSGFSPVSHSNSNIYHSFMNRKISASSFFQEEIPTLGHAWALTQSFTMI